MWLLQQRSLRTRITLTTAVDDTFEGGNTVPHKNVYIRKTDLQKMQETTET